MVAIIRPKDLPSTVTLNADDRVLVDDGASGVRSIDKDDFFAAAAAATTAAKGIVELATDAEAKALSDSTRAITPANLAAVLALDVQTFTTVGANTWTKPAVGQWALIEIIPAGGGGPRRSVGNGSGGGPGVRIALLVPLSTLGATETVTNGAGGAVQLTDNTDGNPGGTTSFGTLITMYGARGGQQAAAANALSGGGSAYFSNIWAAGANNSSGLIQGAGAITVIAPYFANVDGAAATGVTAANAVQTFGLVALLGPAGGAGHSSVGPASGAQNTSLKAGNGGAGNGAGAGGNGANPGGGGGSGTVSGGKGGDARVTVTVF